MPRKNKSFTHSAPRPSSRPAPAASAPSTPSAHSVPSAMNSIKDSIISGFGFGIGSSIAHKVSDSIFTPSPTTPPPSNQKIDCNQMKNDMQTCMESYNRDCNSLINFYYKECNKIDS